MFRHLGLIAAAHTPFRETSSGDLALDTGTIPEQARFLEKAGAIGVFVCGSTGEGPSMTVAERAAVTEAWTAAGSSLRVLAHVGTNCGRDAAELAALARKAGAAGVAAVAPSYFRPATIDDLLRFLEPIATAAGDLPFYYYDIPSLTHVHLPADEILARAGARFPNLAGLKFTNADLVTLELCLGVEPDRFEVLYGVDELLLPALALGVRGAIGSTYNCVAPGFLALMKAHEAGDLATARRLQREANRFIRAIAKQNVVAGSKAVMKMMGLDLGPVRAPLPALGPDGIEALRRDLADLDPILFPVPPSDWR